MKQLMATFVLTTVLGVPAHAEIWKWIDESGTVHFADRPQHESAMDITLNFSVTRSRSSEPTGFARMDSGSAVASTSGESETERQRRESAEAYFCEKAKEIYDDYSNAPRLYKTLDNGDRHYLSDTETEQALASSKAKIDQWCR